MALRGRAVTAETHLECPECKYVATIYRRRSRMKGKKHVKHMHCPFCEEVQGFIEVKDDAFLPEWLREDVE